MPLNRGHTHWNNKKWPLPCTETNFINDSVIEIMESPSCKSFTNQSTLTTCFIKYSQSWCKSWIVCMWLLELNSFQFLFFGGGGDYLECGTHNFSFFVEHYPKKPSIISMCLDIDCTIISLYSVNLNLSLFVYHYVSSLKLCWAIWECWLWIEKWDHYQHLS